MTLRLAALLLPILFLAACDSGTPETGVVSDQPQRIVTLAPHLAELVVAVDAGERLVGVSAWTDFPEELKALPIVGDAFGVDQEQLAALNPDLILAWASGTPADTITGLRAAGYRVEVIYSESLADIPSSVRLLGRLTGEATMGDAMARGFEEGIRGLSSQYRDAASRRFFLQIAERPLYTVNDEHYISELLGLCGGVNVFADMSALSATVDMEAVISRDPEVLFALGSEASLAHWERWDSLSAVQAGRLHALDGGVLGRPTMRVLEAGRQACEQLHSTDQPDP